MYRLGYVAPLGLAQLSYLPPWLKRHLPCCLLRLAQLLRGCPSLPRRKVGLLQRRGLRGHDLGCQRLSWLYVPDLELP